MEIEEVKTQKFIIKFFPEIMIKGTAARRQQINQLSNNLIKLLKRTHHIRSSIHDVLLMCFVQVRICKS